MPERKLCSIDGCGKPSNLYGMCRMHSTRFLRHGDPLKKVFKGEKTEAFIRDVISFNETDDCILWPYSKDHKGYIRVWIDGKKVSLTRFLCEKVNGPPPSRAHQAAHSCVMAKIGCCNQRHLRWATPKENSDDKIIHGTVIRGEESHAAKLKDEDVIAIRSLAAGMQHKEIATIYGVHSAHICKIINHKKWAHIS